MSAHDRFSIPPRYGYEKRASTRITEEKLLLAQQAVEERRRQRRWALLSPVALVLTYLTMLINHPLGLILTGPPLVIGLFTAFYYFDGGTVSEKQAALDRVRARYATQMLEENP